MGFLKIIALAVVIVTAGFAESKAALIEYTGAETASVLPFNFDPNGSTTLTAGSTSITQGDAVSVYVGGGLQITQNAHLTFTYLGYEAGFQNKFLYNSELLFVTRDGPVPGSASPIPSVREFSYIAGVTPSLLDFSFWSGEVFGDGTPSNGGSGVFNTNGSYSLNTYSIGFAGKTSNSVILLFGDGNNTNRDNDFDDMAILLEVSAVPLPPSAILFGTALLGLGAFSRHRKKKAAAA